MEIDAPDGGGDQSSLRSPRFTHWMAFLILSTVTMGSTIEANKDDAMISNPYTKQSSKNWAIACSAITFSVTFIVVAMHLNSVSSLFIVGTLLEGIIIVILNIFWVATVWSVTDDKGIAMTASGAVSNGNIYYFSWAGFVCAVTLLTSYLAGKFQVDVAGELRNRSKRLTTWSAHLASAMVVMGSSASIYDNKCTAFKFSDTLCSRSLYAICIGCISSFIALIIIGMKIANASAPYMLESGFAFLFLICYGVEVALVTSPRGPGAPLGNLYYFSWAAFLSSFFLVASIVEDYNNARNPAEESDEPKEDVTEDVQL